MLLIATHNPNKLREISEILAPISCIGSEAYQIPEPEETGLTFIENALIKARSLSLYTQKSVIADDSGLIVPGLNGAPGIYSARYAGPSANSEQNRELLLNTMQGIQQRQAYFFCAMVFLRHAHDPAPLIAFGQWHGEILHEPRGTHGFAYDSLFWLNAYQCTAAELEPSVKNQISHRAQALLQLKEQMIYHGLFDNPR